MILPTNINLEGSLGNGLVGMVMGFKSTDSPVKFMYVKFNDQKSGKIAM